ncbi:MAG TPA: tetratricopeptide repeat protein [Polyangia bacterium]
MMERLQAQMDAALDDGDDAARQRLVDELDEYSRRFFPRVESYRARLRVRALAADEKWSEALESLRQMGDTAVGTNERVAHDNLVAWCCAHAGETAPAVGLARANAEAPADARMRPYLLGTLGAALILDGQHAAALAPLRDALALGGPRWAQAVRRYYLGEALAALGRFDEARAEWHQAVTIAPRSRWGRRAQERLADGAPAAYR